MELKIARTELSGKPKSVNIDKMLETIKKDGEVIYYLDNSNSHKDIKAAIKKIQKSGSNAYLRELKYGLDDEDYIYQVHVV